MIDITSALDERMDRDAYQEEIDYWVQEAFAIRRRMVARCMEALMPLTMNMVEEDRIRHPRREAYRGLTTQPDAALALQVALLWGHLAWVAFKGWKP